MTGKTIGHYRILNPLGKGGMGEVYLAEDTRLKREVAIKVLPERLRNDAERLKRFRREAEAAASLKHPNIATIHALEEFDGDMFITMEHVEGKPLKDLIPDDGMDIGGAVGGGDMGGKGVSQYAPAFFDVFIPLADALVHAHAQGRIHRDLKPGNIMIAEDGTPKILDFGLARIIDPDPVQAAIEESETGAPLGPDDKTRTMDEEEQRKAAEAAEKGLRSLTRGGQLMGTPQYMSPEQAEREDTDARTDIFSFGVVMYEALTGQRPFEGKTVESVIGRITEKDPEPVTTLKPVTPYQLWWTIRNALEKDRDRRTQTAREIHRDLLTVQQEVQSGTALVDADHSVTPSLRHSVTPSLPLRPIYAAAFALLLAALTATTAWLLKPLPEQPLRKYIAAEGEQPVISPDGTMLAYITNNRLWIRDLDQIAPREMPDTEGAQGPFWSPSSDFVGYFVGRTLRKISSEGGPSIVLADLQQGVFTKADWGSEESIIISQWNMGMTEVSSQGGQPRMFITPDSADSEFGFMDVHVLPDKQSLLYVAQKNDGSGALVLHTDDARTTVLSYIEIVDNRRRHIYSRTGHLLYPITAGDRTDLWAMPFSLDTASSTGDPILVAPDAVRPSISSDGTLAYQSVAGRSRQLVLVDRSGKIEDTIGSTQYGMRTPALSPNGRRVAVTVAKQGNSDIWIYDITRNDETRLTFDPAIDDTPSWSSDGTQIAYVSFKTGKGDIYLRQADGTGTAQNLVSGPLREFAQHISRNGQFMTYYVLDPNTSRDLWFMPLTGERTPAPFLQTDSEEMNPRLSPDARYIAYQSNESGRWEIYVKEFPSGGGKWQVSTNGGAFPRWNGRGDELFFVEQNTLMAVSVSTVPTFERRTASPLFSGDQIGVQLFDITSPWYATYDVSSDGQHFVMVRDVDADRPPTITVVQNWIKQFEPTP